MSLFLFTIFVLFYFIFSFLFQKTDLDLCPLTVYYFLGVPIRKKKTHLKMPLYSANDIYPPFITTWEARTGAVVLFGFNTPNVNK